MQELHALWYTATRLLLIFQECFSNEIMNQRCLGLVQLLATRIAYESLKSASNIAISINSRFAKIAPLLACGAGALNFLFIPTFKNYVAQNYFTPVVSKNRLLLCRSEKPEKRSKSSQITLQEEKCAMLKTAVNFVNKVGFLFNCGFVAAQCFTIATLALKTKG